MSLKPPPVQCAQNSFAFIGSYVFSQVSVQTLLREGGCLTLHTDRFLASCCSTLYIIMSSLFRDAARGYCPGFSPPGQQVILQREACSQGAAAGRAVLGAPGQPVGIPHIGPAGACFAGAGIAGKSVAMFWLAGAKSVRRKSACSTTQKG